MSQEIIFKESKPNHYYIKNIEGDKFLETNPKIGETYEEVEVIAGG